MRNNNSNTTSVLYLLTSESHQKLSTQLTAGREKDFSKVAPDEANAQYTGKYCGRTGPYRALAMNTALENDWQVCRGDKVALYVHYREKNILTIAVQSITEPGAFCCAGLNKDGNGVRRVNSTRPSTISHFGNHQNPPVPRLSGAYENYLGETQRLIIVSDCLQDVLASQRSYLIEEAIGLAKEVTVVTPELILSEI